MKKVWDIMKYFFAVISVIFAVISVIGIIFCIYKKEIYLAFKGFFILILWISMIFEDSHINKNKIVSKAYFGSVIVLISLSILEIFSA